MWQNEKQRVAAITNLDEQRLQQLEFSCGSDQDHVL
jgi:hypothetical protein